ncbi:dihydrodipicolinate synthase family protein [soil metagenome]
MGKVGTVPQLRLDGIVPAVSLPMTSDAAPDLHAYRRYLDWVVDQEPVAIAVNADTGEGPHLLPEERRAVVDAALDAVGDRVPVICGLGAANTAQAIEAARQARQQGAAALLVFPIAAYLGSPLGPEVPYAYHAAIADAADLPLILFQLQPALGGTIFDEVVLARLVNIPSVVAIKEASFDALRFVQLRDQLADLRPISLLTGNDNFILESFVLGATGALIGMSAIAVREQVEMVRSFQRGDMADARARYERLSPLIRAVFGSPVRDYRARIKEGLVMQGVIPDATVRPPLLPIPADDRERVRQGLEAAGLLTRQPA